MTVNEYMNLTLTISELYIFLTHLMVHVGAKNPNLEFLMKQWHYFTFDCLMTVINLYLNWSDYGYFMRSVLIFAIFIHIYYVYTMICTNYICRIFYWSCVDCKEDRFSIKFLKENCETTMDIFCHFVGFVMFFKSLSTDVSKWICLGATVLSVFIINKTTPDFYTKEHMMPRGLVNKTKSI
jgi:hypothetical protein